VPATARAKPLRHGDDRALARSIRNVGDPAAAELVAVGADRDDAALSARKHPLEGSLHREERALGVHREDAVPLLGADLEQRQRGDDPGARHKAVDPAELALGQFEDCVDLEQIGDVGAKVADFAGELTRGRLQALSIEVRQQHPRTLPAGGARYGATHPGRGTGHDDHLIANLQKIRHSGP